MPDIQFRGVKAQEAIDHIRQKVRIPTSRWDEMLGEPHAKGFTVAGAVQADLLKDLHGAVTQAIENGESISDFRKRFDQVVQTHGWTFKGHYGWRTRVIYDTNLRTAHMAGRWKQIERNKKHRPYLVYMTVGDERVREEHSTWHKLAAAVDDSFWSTHYPPNGWGCRCYVISATKKQVERMDAELVENPTIERTERINPTTGEIYGEVPVGIDTGWDYNVGKAWLGPEAAYGQKAMQLPPAIRKTLLDNTDTQALNSSWKSWLKQVDEAPNARGYAHTVGYLDGDTVAALQAKGIMPESATITVYDNQTNHLRGEHKGKSKAIPEAWIQNLPERLANYQAILLHKKTDNLVIVLPGAGGKTGRAVVEVNFKRKGQTINSLRSLGMVDIVNLRQRDYEVLVGELK